MGKNIVDARPDPDQLLQNLQKESRGKLTVFLGAAAGVGKTYHMLETTHTRLAEGVHAMIGWIETHGRQETEKLVEGIPRIPAKTIEYREKQLQEMDIDAILSLRPELVLVDELAHTNVPGSRHVRRFQDVEELLLAGIHVYTTMNVQHIESLNDMVAQITGVTVRETVPDYVLENADTIQLIDIPSEELIKRLKEGKVYIPGQAEQALKKFFRPGNINALRELSLRFTARRVDKDLEEYMKAQRIPGPWPAAERVMVCISGSPFSAQLIRAAHRFSSGLQADFLAVHIETTARKFPEGPAEKERVTQNMRLAEELGAKTITVAGSNLVETILDISRTYNVTAIVIGKPHHSRLWEFLHGSFVDTLIRKSGNLNVYVIQGNPNDEINTSAPVFAPAAAPSLWYHYAGGIIMTVLVTIISWWLKPQLEQVNIALLYLIPVLLTAFWWGRWPSYLTALSGVLVFDFLFVPPIYNFSVYDIRYIWSFVIFLLVSFLIGGRTELLRLEANTARQREKSIRALYDFSREIAAVIDEGQIIQELVTHAGEAIDRKTLVLLPDSANHLSLRGSFVPLRMEEGQKEDGFSDSEYAVAVWAFQHGQPAGRSTDTLPGAQYLYVPLVSNKQVHGIFGIMVPEKKLPPEERRLIDAWASLAALSLERINLAEKAHQATVLIESERLRATLFNSISHELRTPLSAITGAISALMDRSVTYDPSTHRELLETVHSGAIRMERVTANLLDTARLESGMLKLKADWCDIEDIIGSALRRLGDDVKKHTIITRLAPDLPIIRGDCVLLEQVLLNLCDNSMKYSPAGSTITIAAVQETIALSPTLHLSVTDNGPGIPPDELELIFEKFYRSPLTSHSFGTGLGLSICKSIIEAHNGKIWAEETVSAGTAIHILLPLCYDGVEIPKKQVNPYD